MGFSPTTLTHPSPHSNSNDNQKSHVRTIYRALSVGQPSKQAPPQPSHQLLSTLHSSCTLKPAPLSRAACNRWSSKIAPTPNAKKRLFPLLHTHILGGGVLRGIAVHRPGLGYGTLELVGADVVHAHRRSDAALEERHALLSVAVFHGIRETLPSRRRRQRRRGRGHVRGGEEFSQVFYAWSNY